MPVLRISPHYINYDPYPYYGYLIYFDPKIQSQIAALKAENKTINQVRFLFNMAYSGSFTIALRNESKTTIDDSDFTSGIGWNSYPIRQELDVVIVQIRNLDFPYNHQIPTNYSDYAIEIEYSHNPPVAPDSLAPEGDTINPRVPIRFSWNSRINQIAFQIQYQVNGGVWQTVSRNTNDRYYEMPANTITTTSGVVNWRVRVAEYTNVYSEYVSSSFNLGAVTTKKPRVISPIGDYVETTKPLNFEWRFDPNIGETQAGWEIKYSTNGGVSFSTLSGTTEQEKIISISNWGSQEAVWQIRVKNQFNEWSEWTELMRFQTVGAPPIPQIVSVSNNNQPIVQWTSSDQESYLLQLYNMEDKLIHTSGKTVGSTTKSYKINDIIKNGKYLIKLTVFNIYDVKSPTVEYTHIIEATPGQIPEVTLFDSKYHISVSSDTQNGRVMRDGKHIGNLINGGFDDYAVESGRGYIYQVATISDTGVYTESIAKSAKIDFGAETIALLSNPKDFILLEYDLDNSPSDNNSYSNDGVAINVHGQSNPFFEYGEFQTIIKSVKYLVEDYKLILNLISKKETVIFRHRNGEVFIGNITAFDYERSLWGWSISFAITKTVEL